jgi:hypothetical protein
MPLSLNGLMNVTVPLVVRVVIFRGKTAATGRASS